MSEEGCQTLLSEADTFSMGKIAAAFIAVRSKKARCVSQSHAYLPHPKESQTVVEMVQNFARARLKKNLKKLAS